MTTNGFDPTTNRVPFMLLTEVEQEELKAWPHGWQYFDIGLKDWDATDQPAWFPNTAYRGKPAPVVTSKWFNVYPYGPSRAYHPTRELAERFAYEDRTAVLRIDTCNGVLTAHLEEI